MTIRDPRKSYDDLIITNSRETLDPEEFEATADSGVATAGWLVLGFVFDDEDRVLLIDQPWADGWMVPGGSTKPGESFSAAVTREVQEETGIKSTPVRSHAVDEFTFMNERTDETTGWTTVFFESVADTTEIKNELGIEDEEINGADWFERLPNTVFDRVITEEVYQKCLRNR